MDVVMPAKKNQLERFKNEIVEEFKHHVGLLIEEVDHRFNTFTDAVSIKLDLQEQRYDRRFDTIEKDVKLTQAAVRMNREEILKNRHAIGANKQSIDDILREMAKNRQTIKTILGEVVKINTRIDEHAHDIESLKAHCS